MKDADDAQDTPNEYMNGIFTNIKNPVIFTDSYEYQSLVLCTVNHAAADTKDVVNSVLQ